MSHLVGSDASLPHQRRKLLIKTSLPESWSDILNYLKPRWDVTWALDDEQFGIELSSGEFPVAACDSIQESIRNPNYDPMVGSDDFPAPAVPHVLHLTSNSPASSSTTFVLLGEPHPWSAETWADNHTQTNLLTEISPHANPLEFERWLNVAWGISQLKREKQQLERRLASQRTSIVGHSPQIERLREQIATLAAKDWPVLIEGEPGSGRDLIARAIYEASARSNRPFIKIDCRVHSSATLERELFGTPGTSLRLMESGIHRTTGAPGRLELAEGGVLLIDGIDEMALPLQSLLSEVMSTGQLPGSVPGGRSLNVRIIAIAGNDLEQLSAAGQFREELLRQFAGPTVKAPPLRDIRSDLALITEHLLHRIATRLGCGPIRLLVETLERLQAYAWPGNVAELESLLERACQLNPESKLTAEMIEAWIPRESNAFETRLPGISLGQMERQLIEATFARCGGNRELTANSLQIGLRTLSGKLRDYGYPPRGGPGSNRQAQYRDRDAA